LFRFLLPLQNVAKAQAIIIPKSQLPVNATKEVMIGETPSIVLNIQGKGILAFSRVCTHLGCLVKYYPDKQEFICPCHAGTFDLDGNVVSGPPPKPLQQFAVKVQDGNLVIG
ncbi:MAG TPA: Rieske (2Fe-2S) protein, partial [Desulfobaccales bacterium]